jgi:hypothetical protein
MLRAEANKHGLFNCAPRRPWTPAEDEIIREKIGVCSVGHLAKTLDRTWQAVKWRAGKLNLSIRPADGFSVDDLVKAFGVYELKVRRWAERGLLGKVNKAVPPVGWRFTESAVIRFIRSYPHEYSLARVDQTWFKGMLFGTPGMKLAGKYVQGEKKKICP